MINVLFYTMVDNEGQLYLNEVGTEISARLKKGSYNDFG